MEIDMMRKIPGGHRFLAPSLIVWGSVELRGAHEAGARPYPRDHLVAFLMEGQSLLDLI